MSMNNANYMRSPCEVLREINDLFQGDTEKDELVRKLLAEAEAKTKRMSIELTKYDQTSYLTWWDKILDYSDRLMRRKNPSYKFYKK